MLNTRSGMTPRRGVFGKLAARPIPAPVYAAAWLIGIALLAVADSVLDGWPRKAVMLAAGALCLWLPMQLVTAQMPLLPRKPRRG